jgi:hypothetical protein
MRQAVVLLVVVLHAIIVLVVVLQIIVRQAAVLLVVVLHAVIVRVVVLQIVRCRTTCHAAVVRVVDETLEKRGWDREIVAHLMEKVINPTLRRLSERVISIDLDHFTVPGESTTSAKIVP